MEVDIRERRHLDFAREPECAARIKERRSRFPGQFDGLAKVDSGFDYAANFSSLSCVA